MAESQEELNSLLSQVKAESAKASELLNIKSARPSNSFHIDGEDMWAVTDFIFLGSKIIADGDCSNEIKRRLLF